MVTLRYADSVASSSARAASVPRRNSPPQVSLVTQIPCYEETIIGVGPGKKFPALFFLTEQAGDVEKRELVGAHRRYRQPGFFYPGQGNSQIIVSLQGCANQ